MRMNKGLIALGVVAALLLAGAGVAWLGDGRESTGSHVDASGGGSAASSVTESPDAPVAGEDPVSDGDAMADGGTAAAGYAADPAGPASRDTATKSGSGSGTGNGLGGLPTPELQAQVVKTATIDLEVGRREGRETVHEVVDAVGLVGGFVASTDQSGGFARLTVRVPSRAFDETLHRFRKLGRERGLEIHGEDVTGAVTDLEARLRNLRAQEAVLIGLMGRATTIGDSIAVQQQLSQNQEQIEQLEGQRRALADQTTFATISISVRAKGAPVPTAEESGGLAGAWDDALDASVAVIGGVLVVLGALLPLLVLVGLGLLVWRLVARSRRPRPAAPAAG
jgi:hypothetical protein